MPGRTDVKIRVMIQQRKNNICLGDRFNNGKCIVIENYSPPRKREIIPSSFTHIHNLHGGIEKVILNHLPIHEIASHWVLHNTELCHNCKPTLFQNLYWWVRQRLFSVGFICVLFLFTLVHPMHCLDNLCYTGQIDFKFIFIAQSIPQ